MSSFVEQYGDYKWIKVPKYKINNDKSWEDRYKELEQHHIEETSFLIKEVRKLAAMCDDLYLAMGTSSPEEDDRASESE